MKTSAEIVEAAQDFLFRNARLLDRQLYAFHFRGGSRDAVISALLAYQNEDGGFGNGLEPDIRCPESQTVPAQHALEILDEVGFESEVALRLCDFLQTITIEEGGVPFVLPAVNAYPHAPWWGTDVNPPASLNPTAAIAGLLHKNGVTHPWLDRATEYCWKALAASPEAEPHQLSAVFIFLNHAPDRKKAENLFRTFTDQLLNSGLVANASDDGYVKKPLDWAASPSSSLRPLFSNEQIAANLNDMISRQREDGGWPIAWPPVGVGAEMEWRGWVTVSALKTLRAYGRL